MDPFNAGRAVGYVIGSILFPLFLAWLIVWGYEKIKKRRVVRRKTAIAVIAVILFVLALVGRAVGSGQSASRQTATSTPIEARPVDVKGIDLPGGWKYYEFIDQKFGIAFPAAPSRIERTLADGTLMTVFAASFEGAAYTATYVPLSAREALDAANLLAGVVDGAREGMNARVVKNEPGTFQGNQSRVYELQGEKTRARGVVFVVKNGGAGVLYNLSVAAEKEVPAAPYERFIGFWKALAP